MEEIINSEIDDFNFQITNYVSKLMKENPDSTFLRSFDNKSGIAYTRFIFISSDEKIINDVESYIKDVIEERIKVLVNRATKKLVKSSRTCKLAKQTISKNLRRKLKRYDIEGNVVMNCNLAHHRLFSEASIRGAIESYCSKVEGDLFKKLNYINDENEFCTQLEIERKIIRDGITEFFEPFLHKKISQIISYEITGNAHLISFFDVNEDKTIHTNLGNFVLIFQKYGELGLQKAPLRKRRADNKIANAVAYKDPCVDKITYFYIE